SSAQLCAGKSFQENGNWYCQPVHHITYQNVGAVGEYQDVVRMDQQSGACEFQKRKFSGPLAPFDEPMYIHFRGPLRLKQVAVYLPGSDQRKRDEAHYHAARQSSSGLTFLANRGDPYISGNFTRAFGNTLSYVDRTGTSCSPSSQTLLDTLLPSSAEVILATDQPCNAACGYIQPGSIARKGFASVSGTRVVMMDFSMPHAYGEDMPAIWMLNARIPLTGQYHGCSCWASGCGEFDVFETLSQGETKAKSTFHSVFRGGDSNYFDRPTEGTVRVAVWFD
ncbi:putative TOS1-like glycosyl hydrolase-domain-containing protein, partial [Immersiella caudata]